MRLVTSCALALGACKQPVTGLEGVIEFTQRHDVDDYVVDMAYVRDGSGDYVVGYRGGLVEARNAAHDVVASTELAVRTNHECGVMAVEVDPSYRSNQRIYVGYCVAGGNQEIAALTLAEGAAPGAPVRIIEVPAAVSDYHNLGDMGWDDSGNLWFTNGDGSTFGTSQDLMDLRGKLCRITPTPGGAQPYTIPADNPFYGNPAARPEIVAYGIKSSFRGDFANGAWLLGDVGLDTWEEINLVTLDGPKNLGYPLCEGNEKLVDYRATGEPCDLSTDHAPPQLAYAQEKYDQAVFTDDPDAERGSLWAVVGGVLYRGQGYEGRFSQRFIYADHGRGFVRSMRLADGALSEDAPIGHLARIAVFVESPAGVLQAVANNRLFRIE